jgi:hypothetical protein
MGKRSKDDASGAVSSSAGRALSYTQEITRIGGGRGLA